MNASLTDFWIVVPLLAVGTFLLRFSFIGFGEHVRLPKAVERGLKYIPSAVIPAIILPGVLFSGGSTMPDLSSPKVPAWLFAALIAWRTKNMLLTISSGMAVLWLLTWLGY